jgi:hypothetical protein
MHYESEFATVRYDDESDVVVARMDEFAEGEAFREYMNAIVDAAEANGTSRVLSDTTDQPTLNEDDKVWAATEWSSEAERRGVEHVGMVVPESALAQMSVESILEQTPDDGIDRDVFDSVDEAREWLEGQ